MKIIIVGNGKVGYAIASQLAGEHHDIVMVDDSAAALHKAENALDVMCIEGNGASIRVLKEAGAQAEIVSPDAVRRDFARHCQAALSAYPEA